LSFCLTLAPATTHTLLVQPPNHQPTRGQIPHAEEAFFEWLGGLDCSQMKIHALKDGTACFAKEPIIRVEGPLAVAQLLETTLLNLVNYPSLIATNAARHRLVRPSSSLLAAVRRSGSSKGLSQR
jgi:nicotinate phosphoribosyltransferase